MSHPMSFLKSLEHTYESQMFKMGAWERRDHPVIGTGIYAGEEIPNPHYSLPFTREDVQQNKLDRQLFEAMALAGYKNFGKNLDKLEAGINIRGDKDIWIACDLVIAKDNSERQRVVGCLTSGLQRAGKTGRIDIRFYDSGNSYHVYTNVFTSQFPDQTHSQDSVAVGIFEGILGIDPKWLQFFKDNHQNGGYLRWTPGSKGRPAPFLLEPIYIFTLKGDSVVHTDPRDY